MENKMLKIIEKIGWKKSLKIKKALIMKTSLFYWITVYCNVGLVSSAQHRNSALYMSVCVYGYTYACACVYKIFGSFSFIGLTLWPRW